MNHYIDKAALVAEIEKLKYSANTEADIASTGECFNEDIANVKYQQCEHILGIIDTLEVKEVGKEKDTKNMIIIERTWREPDPRGGSKLHKEERKCFFGDDKDGIDEFINAKAYVPGYEWTDVEYKYIKV